MCVNIGRDALNEIQYIPPASSAAADLSSSLRLFEVQYWYASTPPVAGNDPEDEDTPMSPDCGDSDADELDEYFWPDYLVRVVSHEYACDTGQAIRLAMARIGASSVEHYLENMCLNPDDMSFLEAQDDEAKFLQNLGGNEE